MRGLPKKAEIIRKEHIKSDVFSPETEDHPICKALTHLVPCIQYCRVKGRLQLEQLLFFASLVVQRKDKKTELSSSRKIHAPTPSSHAAIFDSHFTRNDALSQKHTSFSDKIMLKC